MSGEFRSKGKSTDSWDGLDQWGKPLPVGSYVLKGIYHPKVTTDYVMTFGNPGNPPWPTADDKGDWLSDEAAPQAVASDGKWIFLGAPGSEKGSSIIALDEHGQRQWGLAEPFYPMTVSLAVDGDYLYALFSGPKLTDSSRHYRPGGSNAVGRAVLVCLEKRTGRAAKFTLKDPLTEIVRWPFTGETIGLWELRKQQAFSPDSYSGQPRYDQNDIGETTNAIGLAAANHRVYISMHKTNQLLVLDADTGATVDQIPLLAPAGLFAEAGNSILAISGSQVVRINPANKQVQTIVRTKLAAPRCVATDHQNRIYVSDWGPSFQVKVFSPIGELLHSVGKLGGRPWVGPWESGGMLVPTGIAVADDGKLWVAEDDASPKRISVWNSDTGLLVKDYVGPAPYGGPGAILEAKDPTEAMAMGTRFRIDPTAQTWTPTFIPERRMDVSQPFALNGSALVMPGQKLLHHDGDEYQIALARDSVVVHKRRGNLLVPVAAVGSIRQEGSDDGTARTIWDSDLGYRLVENFYPSFFRGRAGSNYAWSDRNNDGLVQPEEMRWLKAWNKGGVYQAGTQPEADTYWGFGIGSDWSIYWSGSFHDKSIIFRLDVNGWTADGAPLYDIRDSTPIVVRDRTWEPQGLFATDEGTLIATYNYESAKTANAIECFDRNGNSLWALAMPKSPPEGSGQGPKDILAQSVIYEFHFPGIGNVLGAWLWHGNYATYLFTDKGLYVSTLLKDTHLGPDAGWDESYKSYYQDAKGIPYIINGANDSYHILRINGLGQGGRFEEPFSLSQSDFATASEFRKTPASKPRAKPIINVGWAGQAPRIDGDLSDWKMRNGIVLEGSNGRAAKVSLARDNVNLYLAYEVKKDRPFINRGENWQTLFASGDCVDLMLASGTDTNAKDQNERPGDERLLISLLRGKPIAVLYRPKVPGTGEPVQIAAARIDEIKRLDAVKVSILSHGNSYTVEAEVPLKDLGIDPAAKGSLLQGDVGVIYSDATGNNRELRLYYYNQKTSTISDLTTEARLQPAEWGDVQFPLGENRLKDGGFEDGFAASADLGWFRKAERNGATANVSAAASHSGLQSLLLAQTTPVLFSASSFTVADYNAFKTSANNGAGGGEAIVQQRVAVVSGHVYDFRLRYRTDKLNAEKKSPGPGRGYSSLQVQIEWFGQNIAPTEKYRRVLNAMESAPDWLQLTNASSQYQALPRPYRAPEGAATAVISFRLITLAADDLPTAFVDDVEFVDVTPNQ